MTEIDVPPRLVSASDPSARQLVAANRELQLLRGQAAARVAEADQLEQHAAAHGLDPSGRDWVLGRFECFLAELTGTADRAIAQTRTAVGRAAIAPQPKELPPSAVGDVTAQPLDGSVAARTAPAVPESSDPQDALPARGEPATVVLVPPAPAVEPALAAPSLSVPPDAPSLLAKVPGAPGDGAELTSTDFERSFWHDDEPSPWPVRLRGKLRLSRAAALQVGALVALALALLVYFS